MPNTPNQPIDYRSPAPRPPSETGAHFFAALLIGTLASGIVHGWIWHDPKHPSNAMLSLVLALVFAKIVGSTVAFVAGRRAFASGLLASLAVGGLIFFGLCALGFRYA